MVSFGTDQIKNGVFEALGRLTNSSLVVKVVLDRIPTCNLVLIRYCGQTMPQTSKEHVWVSFY
jgi:hypothetical protein